MDKRDIKPLTGIRFLAAFYVFIFHIDLRTPLTFPAESLQIIIKQGAIGVNIFFTLSGFILAYTYIDKSISYKDFIKKRLIRIYPAYFTVLLVCLLVSLCLKYYPPPFMPIVIANVFMVQSYFPPISMLWYGGGSWSISTEFFFYLVFPLILPVLKSARVRTLYFSMILTIIISSVPGWFANAHPSVLSFFISYTFPVFRLPEYLCGMIAGVLIFRHGFKISYVTVILTIVLAVSCLVLVQVNGYVIQNIYVLPAVLSVLCLVAVRKGILIDWLGSPVMVYLGKISYGFYIVQIGVMLPYEILLERGVLSRGNYSISPLVFVITLILSILMFEYIEKPLHKRFSQKIKLTHRPEISQREAITK